MKKPNKKVIGYFAASKGGDVAWDGPACIVAGSYKTLKAYLDITAPKSSAEMKIRKTWFSDIMTGMKMGGAYAFDRESYGKFAPLAREAGMDCEDFDFKPDADGGMKFCTIFPT